MSNTIKLNVKSTEQEISINDLNLILKYDDESLEKYEKEVITIAKEMEDAPNDWATVKGYIIQLGDLIFDEGVGFKIYEACNKSSAVAVNVMYQILDLINERIDEAVALDNTKLKKYTSKVRK